VRHKLPSQIHINNVIRIDTSAIKASLVTSLEVIQDYREDPKTTAIPLTKEEVRPQQSFFVAI